MIFSAARQAGLSLAFLAVALAHDGVPKINQAYCCKDDCATVDDHAFRRSDGDYQLEKSGQVVSRFTTFFSTNGETIVCPYSRLEGGIRCLFVPLPLQARR